jgi:hypothetical protein
MNAIFIVFLIHLVREIKYVNDRKNKNYLKKDLDYLIILIIGLEHLRHLISALITQIIFNYIS